MKKNLLITSMMFAVFVCGCVSMQQGHSLPEDMQPGQIKSVMTKVADWQLANPSRHATTHWTHGALFAGMTAWAQMADSDQYYDALLGFGEKNGWQPHERKNNVYHADDHAVAQMYIEMYKKYKDPKMIAPIKELYDYILANQPNTPLTHDNAEHKKRYNWCDALFMAPPVWTKLARITGETKYLDYMNKEWWATTEYLYDTQEHLYFRDDRFFEKREANGEKIFWSRGNGWVFGGLVRVLEEMPEDYPNRAKYVKIYKEMAAKIMEIQPAEGLWHSSLLDPVGFPSKEASGSGFYCYGLAWGINHGLLDAKTYLPAVIKAWAGLVNCVHPDGKLGNVQPIGANPRHVTADQTEIYGVGAFLLAGSEVYKIAVRKGAEIQKVVVENPTLSFRDSETVSLDWNDVKKSVSGLTKDNVAVFDFKTNSLLLTQVVEDESSPELLFQTNLAAGEKKYFWIMKQPAEMKKPESKAATFCRFIPERKDDFAWENDKVAFRMYGPALEDETITCGIDAWVKCVETPIVDKFYKSKNYHKNHGEGGDFYKVGNTLGCGGAAAFVGGKVFLPARNFKEWKILANGPIRSVFELTYASFKAGSMTVRETKRISIDLGSHMNKIECFYSSDDAKSIPVVAGIILRASSDKKYTDKENIIAYWLPADGKNGMMGCGVVYEAGIKTQVTEAENHLLMKAKCEIGKPFVYYSGSCWDENAECGTFSKWQGYLNNFKERIDNPVIVGFGNTDSYITEIPLEQVQQALKKSPDPHPRLFISDKQLPAIMRNIQASDELKILHKELIRQADDLIGKKPLERIQIGRRLLSVSREALRRLQALSWAYRTTDDKKYLKRAEQEMLTIADFSDWNPSHFLDVAEMTTALAIGYDWLHNDLSAESRERIRKAIVEKGIRPSLYKSESGKPLWWVNGTNNWNQVCHGGMTCGALAVMEDEPELAETIIHRSVNKVQVAMSEYEPHGAYPEGPGYWGYGTAYNVILIEAIDSALGTDFGLSEKETFAKSAEYYLHAAGPTGLYFNYGDCGSRGGFNPTVLWFANKYKDPSLLWNQKKIFDSKAKQESSGLAGSRTSVTALLWGMPEATRPERLSWMGQGRNPVAMFRTSWDDDATYLAIKGGDTSFHHAHMDSGSFVIDAEGLRWAMDLGRESYHKIETMGGKLWSRAQDGDRWKLFRYGTYAHNTLTVNGQQQRIDGTGLIVRYSDDSKFPHAVIDMSTIYNGQLKKAIRGASLLPSGQILIQDELQATDKPATVRWNMVTPAKVDIKSGKKAVLSQKQKTMQFNVYTEADVKLATYSTEPRSRLDAENGDTRMLGFDVELAANEKVTIQVVMVPGSKEKPLKGDIKNVENWSKPLAIGEPLMNTN